MYRKKVRKQITIFNDYYFPNRVVLNKENRWMKLGEIIPWETIEEKYASKFTDIGAPAK